MSVAQDFGHALLKSLTVIFGLWCIYLSYDQTPLAEFEFIGNACAWSGLASAASLLLMTPFYHLDKKYAAAHGIELAKSKKSMGERITSRCFIVFAVCAILSLIAFMITLPGFLLAKSFVVIRPLL